MEFFQYFFQAELIPCIANFWNIDYMNFYVSSNTFMR